MGARAERPREQARERDWKMREHDNWKQGARVEVDWKVEERWA